MERDFDVPDVGEGLEEATIVEWRVHPGDQVKLNDPLCIIETAKAEVELPSPFAGKVLVTMGEPGQTLRVGELLARFEVADAPGAPAASPPAETASPSAGNGSSRTPTLVGYGVDESAPTTRGGRQWPGRAATSEAPLPAPVAVAPAPSAPAPAPVPAAPAASGLLANGGRPLAKPPVRKMAKDLGVDLASVVPTGARGEITRDDVRASSAAQIAPTTERPRSDAAASYEIPVRGVRARIAERMSVSRSTIPEATCGVWVDCFELMELRDKLKAAQAGAKDAGEAPPITPFTIISWLAVRALKVAPLFNASFRAERAVIEVHGSIHLGIATSTEQGLMVPVIRDAETLGLNPFGAALAALASRARSGALLPTELTGSTFTITNYGALGLDDGNPVINYPESAILGVGSIRPRAAVVDGAVVPRPLMKLICAFDHRVCDGAEAGRYLSRLKELVEHPELVLLDS